MPKLRKRPVTKDDIAEYLRTEDSFALELRTLAVLKGNGYEASHGGIYTDPISDKNREYDIRASITYKQFYIQLAVECKSLRPNFPLLVSCVQRREDEAYHDLVVSQHKPACVDPYQASTIRMNRVHSLYTVGGYVGKSAVQIGLPADNNAEGFVTSDAEFFDKWTQAVSSAYDLFVNATRQSETIRITAVLPILVIPDGTMWQVLYASDGREVGPPTEASESNLFMGKTYALQSAIGKVKFTISHLHIFEFSRFQHFVNQLRNENEITDALFPTERINDFLGTNFR